MPSSEQLQEVLVAFWAWFKAFWLTPAQESIKKRDNYTTESDWYDDWM